MQESSIDSLLGWRVESKFDDLWRLWRVKNGQFFENLDLGLDLSSTIGVVAEAIDEDLDVISENNDLKPDSYERLMDRTYPKGNLFLCSESRH